MIPIKRLGDILVEDGLVTRAQVEQGLLVSRTTGQRLGEVLVEHGILSEVGLTRSLAQQMGRQLLHPSEMTISPAVLNLIPRRIAQECGIIPIEADGNYLTIATADPTLQPISTGNHMPTCGRVSSYDGITFAEGLRLDVLVEELVIGELQAVETMHPVFTAQLLTQLKLTAKRLGFVINFNVPLIKPCPEPAKEWHQASSSVILVSSCLGGR